MLREQLLGLLDNFDGLSVAPDEGEHGAIAVAPHAADESDVDVNGLPRLKARTLNPEAHGFALLFSIERRGRH
jgi:hypothetical protein